MGMTQEELAEALFIPKTTVSSYERDVVDMKMGIIKEIARVLHKTAGYLIDGEKVDLDADVIQVAKMLQEMPEELRRVAMEQVKVLSGMCKLHKWMKKISKNKEKYNKIIDKQLVI